MRPAHQRPGPRLGAVGSDVDETRVATREEQLQRLETKAEQKPQNQSATTPSAASSTEGELVQEPGSKEKEQIQNSIS